MSYTDIALQGRFSYVISFIIGRPLATPRTKILSEDSAICLNVPSIRLSLAPTSIILKPLDKKINVNDAKEISNNDMSSKVDEKKSFVKENVID